MLLRLRRCPQRFVGGCIVLCDSRRRVAATPPIPPPPPPPPPPPQPKRPDSKTNAVFNVAVPQAPASPVVNTEPKEDGKLDMRMFLPFLPSFFVPLDEVAEAIDAGYTAAHLRTLFAKAKEIHMVDIEGISYIRAHGGFNSDVDLSETGEADDTFAQYAPSNELGQDILALLDAVGHGQGWMSLYDLCTVHAPKELVGRLPYKGPASILFFACLPHLFVFDAHSLSIARKDQSALQFTFYDTPIPRTLNFVAARTRDRGIDVDVLNDTMPPWCQAELKRVGAPPLAAALEAHPSVVTVEDGVVTVTQTKQRADMNKLSLKEQMDAVANFKVKLFSPKRALRRLERKAMREADSNHPFFDDKAALAQAIVPLLPESKPVPLQSFANDLPMELRAFIPDEQIKFFFKFPSCFTAFEWKEPNRFFVQRAGLPVPPGALKAEYTVAEVLELCAATVQHRGGGTMLTGKLFYDLPMGARSLVTSQFGKNGIVRLLETYPDRFQLTNTGHTDANRAVKVTLLRH